MTYGWQYEGALDRALALEPTPDPSDERPFFICPFCRRVFPDRGEMDAHVTHTHSMRRPALIINGQEPSRDEVLRHKVVAGAVSVLDCSEIDVAIDGRPPERMRLEKLGATLEGATKSTIHIRLTNAPQSSILPVSYEYRLRIAAPAPLALRSIDDLFVQILGRADPTLVCIDDFNSRTRDGEAPDYAAGLANYVRGVLLKDGDPASGVTGTFHDYSSAFSRSLQALKVHDRALPAILCGFMRLDLNDFSQWWISTGSRRLDETNRMLGMITTYPSRTAKARSIHETHGKLVFPVDAGLHEVVTTCERLVSAPRWSTNLDTNAQTIMNAFRLDPLDRAKLLAAHGLAALRLGANTAAQTILGALDGEPNFGPWAEANLMRIDDQ